MYYPVFSILAKEYRKVKGVCVIISGMNFEFSIGWLFGGLAIAIAGGLIVIFYRQIADNLVNGVSSYDKVKFWGVITIIVGLICMANLHLIILEFITSLIFRH